MHIMFIYMHEYLRNKTKSNEWSCALFVNLILRYNIVSLSHSPPPLIMYSSSVVVLAIRGNNFDFFQS